MVNERWKAYLAGQNINQSTVTDQPFIAALTHQAMMEVSGLDSVKFLQGQLTCDVEAASSELSTLGAACTAKGRIYSSFRLAQQQSGESPRYFMRMRENLLDSTLETLSKYIVFFKSEMRNASADWVSIGVCGDKSNAVLAAFFGQLPTEINQVSQNENGLLIKVPGERNRFECWVPEAHAQTLWEQLIESTPPAGTSSWILQDIRAGIAEISATNIEEHIPQALNYQAVDAISFTKGCYTGQEIVARMHYRGKSKRFTVRALLENAPALETGMTLIDTKSQKNIADVVESVIISGTQQEALLVILDDLGEQGGWHLSYDGQNFIGKPLDLPYSLDTKGSA